MDAVTREAQHRCSNDLQMVASLIRLAETRTSNRAAKTQLSDLARRVSILAGARRALLKGTSRDLAGALDDVCEALRALAQPRGVAITLTTGREPLMLNEDTALVAALAVNELVTNAIKHAFADGEGGEITVCQMPGKPGEANIVIEDSGKPFAAPVTGRGTGLRLIQRMVDQQNGLLIVPENGGKRFELRLKTRLPETVAA